MKMRLKYFVMFMGLWVIFLLLSPSLSFDVFETWFIEILQDPTTVTYYIYTLGSIVFLGVFYIYWTKNEK